MDNEYFLNAGVAPLLHFEPSLSSSPMPTWQALSFAPELNCSSEQSSDCFLNPSWEKSTNQYAHFESALSSMVSSPLTSNSAVSNDNFAIRELIGKLGSICNSGEISPPLLAATAAASAYVGGGKKSTNTSCYSTPLSSPPKLHMPIMDHLVKENLTTLGNLMPLNANFPALSADPGFAERAAKFSCFGSRSFNGRTSQFGLNTPEFPIRSSTQLMGSEKLPRVASSPSLKANGSPMGVQEDKNVAHTQMELRSANCLASVSDKKFGKLSGSTATSNEESSVSEQVPSAETGLKSLNDLNSRKRKAVSRGKAKEVESCQSANATKGAETDDDSNAKRSKHTEGNGKENGVAKTEEETKGTATGAGDNGDKQAKPNSKPPEPPKDYIHVRARRGQATDSHSLAERVRREKISERMKLLQDLVPGCNKVTGKALMLDEIINYVQSLQRQVEFLSMKLASVNPRLDFNMEAVLSKDISQPNGSLPHPIYPVDSSAPAFYGQHSQQSPQLNSNISNGAVSQCSVGPIDATLCRNLGVQLPPADGFSEGLPEFPTLSEDDLQSVVQMGFGQNPHGDVAFHPPSFSCSKSNVPYEN